MTDDIHKALGLPNRPSPSTEPGALTLRTMQRDASGQFLGGVLQFVGVAVTIGGFLAVRKGGVDVLGGGIFLLLGIGLTLFGSYIAKKAQFVAWVREGIEQ